MNDTQADDLRDLLREHWGRVLQTKLLAMAQRIDPTITRRKLLTLAWQLRVAGELQDNQAQIASRVVKAWSPEDVEELGAMAGDYSIRALAYHFGVSEQAVRSKASKLGISLAYPRVEPDTPTEEEWALAHELVARVRARKLGVRRVAYAMTQVAGV